MKSLLMSVFAGALSLAASAAVYYVAPTGVDDAEEGRGGETMPFATPRYALSKATTAGDEVRVMKGVYLLGAAPEIKANNVTLRGWNATREEVVFDAQGNGRCLQFPTNNVGRVAMKTGTFVSGITFRNGRNRVSSDWANWFCLGAGVLLADNYGNEPAGSFVTVSNCVIASCVNETGFGGGLVVGSGSTVVDCVISNNVCCKGGAGSSYDGSYGGAGVYAFCFYGDTTIERCTFTDNIATNGPAAIGSGAYNSVPAAGKARGIVVRSCTFTRNAAYENTNRGGGCFTQRVRLAEDCTFTSNSVALGSSPSSGRAAEGGVFCLAYDFGGAMTNTFRRCTFLKNTSANNSGAIAGLVSTAAIQIESCTFLTNYGSAGYSVMKSSCPVVMRDSLVTGNSSSGPGGWRGIIYLSGKSTVVERCDFFDNTMQGYLGVIRITGTDSFVDGCRFINNKRPYSASCSEWGALEITGVRGTVRNCLFDGNVNQWQPGAGLLLQGANDSVVENCTFLNNKTGVSSPFNLGAGISRGTGTAATGIVIRNCLFYNNGCYATATAAPQIPEEFRGGVTYSWASTDELTVSDATHNVAVGDGKPHFDTKKPNAYTPSYQTPGLNLGYVNNAWMQTGRDLYGERRISGAGVDFGCVERVYNALFLLVR